MDFGFDGSGQGGMDGLMKGHVMVKWAMERQTACGVRCPKPPSEDTDSTGPLGWRI